MDRNVVKSILQFLSGVFAICLVLLSTGIYFCLKSSDYFSEGTLIVTRTDGEYLVDLFDKKNISSAKFLTGLCLKWMQLHDKEPQIGEYKLYDSISLLRALEIVSSGKSVKHKICIPEGFSVAQAIHRLEKNEFLSGEIEEVPPEGSLMPDTYTFKYPTTKQEIITRAKRAMSEFIKKTWQERPKNCELKSPEDLVKLASIVEKERTKTDAASIAGVYLNRLKRGMRLQSCPTAIYAITHGKRLGRPLTFSDLQLRSPYNTYRKAGLPDTPICNPGRESILSVLYPHRHSYFFFAHDRSGKIYMSETFEEHKKNAKKVHQTIKKEDFKKEEF